MQRGRLGGRWPLVRLCFSQRSLKRRDLPASRASNLFDPALPPSSACNLSLSSPLPSPLLLLQLSGAHTSLARESQGGGPFLCSLGLGLSSQHPLLNIWTVYDAHTSALPPPSPRSHLGHPYRSHVAFGRPSIRLTKQRQIQKPVR